MFGAHHTCPDTKANCKNHKWAFDTMGKAKRSNPGCRGIAGIGRRREVATAEVQDEAERPS